MMLGGLAVFGVACVAQAEHAKEGEVKGKVIVVGEDRVVIAKDSGAQMTLEAGWKKVAHNKWVRNPEQMEYFQTFKPGDMVGATWRLDEGTHFCVQRIAKLDAHGKPIRHDQAREAKDKPREGGEVVHQLHALRGEVAQLRKDIAELRELLKKALEEQ